jgi:lysozyme
MKTSPAGRKALIQREGVRLKSYRDSVGVLTIGVGHTSMAGPPEVTPGLIISDAECDEIFARDLIKYETAVNDAIDDDVDDLTPNQFDACVSLCYNIGPGAFAGSSVVRAINAGDLDAAAADFMKWDKPPEIIGRRRTEMHQFMTPYPAEAAT